MGGYLSVPMAVAIAIPLVAGSIVSASTAENVTTWYKTLKKPSWNLPTPIFGPTWGFLYAFLGLATFVVWTQGGFAEQAAPLALYAINLALNLSWMPVFFNQKNIELAQIINVATLVTAILLTRQYHRVKPVAGYLLWPYVAFLTFANALNWFHLQENSDRPIEQSLRDSADLKNPGESGYTPAGSDPQAYRGDDPAAVNKGSKLSVDSGLGAGAGGTYAKDPEKGIEFGKEKSKGIDYGGSTTGDTFQKPGGSTTGGSFNPSRLKPSGALGAAPRPAMRPAPRPMPRCMQAKTLGRGLTARAATPLPCGVAAARFM